MNVPGQFFLIHGCHQLFRLLLVGEETALHDHDRLARLFQQIIAVVSLCLPLVLRIQKRKLFLQNIRKLSALFAGRIVKNLRPLHIFLMEAVLMNAHHKRRIRLLYDLQTPFHILHLLVGSVLVIQPVLILSCHHYRKILRLQEFLQHKGDLKIDVLLQGAVNPNLSGIRPSVSRINHDADPLLLRRLPCL